MRSGVAEGGKYSSCTTPAERENVVSQLAKAEEWLYDHMDDTKQAYIDKLAELKQLGGPVEDRFRDDSQRLELIINLEGSIKRYTALASKVIEKSSGDGDKRAATLEAVCGAIGKWLAAMRSKQGSDAEEGALSRTALEAKL